jgi:MFS family permease
LRQAAVEPSILRQPSFAKFWCSRILSTASFQMLSVAIGWQMYDLTDSAFALGMVGLAQFVSMVLLTLLVGDMADRYDRRTIVCLCQVVEGCAAGVLAVGSSAGWLGRDGIYAVAAVVGACRAFENPTMAALVPMLVPRAMVQQATAWSASANQAAQIVGPALGGLLYALGPATVYATGAAGLLTAGLLIRLIRIDRTRPTPAPPTLRSLVSGLVFVWRSPVLLGTLSLDLFAVLLGGATALLPIFARDILQSGPWTLGLLRSAPAVGALAMSVVLARRRLRRALGPLLFGALAVYGVATMVFAVSTSLPLSLAALAVAGAADVVSVVIRFSLVQLQTPDAMRGRVSAVNALFIGTSNQLGEFESGVLAALMGAVAATLVGGLGTLVVAGVWIYLSPSLWRLRTLEEEHPGFR